MKPAHKQTALKAALFMILAANVSWHTPKAIQSSNLASNASDVGVARGSVPGRTNSADIPVIRIAPPPASVVSAIAPTAVGPKPDAAITTTAVTVKESTEYKKVCAVDFKIHFIQQSEAGKTVVHAYVTQRFPQADFPGLVEEGTYQDLIADAASKAQWDEKIYDTVIAKLRQQGKTCEDQASAPVAPALPSAPQDTTADNEAKRIARGLRNCTLDRDGRALRNSQRYECNLKRLENISLDRSEDEDEITENGRTARRHRRHERSGIAEVQAVLRPLETSIKSLLLSSNEDKQDDGADRLDDVISALEAVRDTASNSNDERAMNRIIQGLQKGYVLGAKVDHAADQYASRLALIDDRIGDLRMSMVGANVYQQMAINNQVQTLMVQRMNTQAMVNSNRDYLQLRAYSQANLIDQSDFSDFTADYNQLLQQISGGSALGLSTASAPADILGMRQQTIANDPRSYGLTNPAFPQINYQQLGLQNPALIGGTNPAFPSTAGFPQTSGFPVTTGFPQTTLPTVMPTTFPQTTFPQTAFPQTMPMNTMPFPQQTMPMAYNPSIMTQPARF